MQTPPGWYPNPNGTQTKRWWDGGAWAPETQAYVAGPYVGHAEQPRTRPFVKWWAFSTLLVASVGACFMFLGRDNGVREEVPQIVTGVRAVVLAKIGLVDPSIHVNSVTCVDSSAEAEVCTVLLGGANLPWTVDVSTSSGVLKAEPRDQIVTELAILHNMDVQCDLGFDVLVLAPGVKFQCDGATYEVDVSGEIRQAV